jgi:hypothetical protein
MRTYRLQQFRTLELNIDDHLLSIDARLIVPYAHRGWASPFASPLASDYDFVLAQHTSPKREGKSVLTELSRIPIFLLMSYGKETFSRLSLFTGNFLLSEPHQRVR